eukprot:COSAG01_NODE_20086_length_971_cov_1.644495_1_plen_142_part_00
MFFVAFVSTTPGEMMLDMRVITALGFARRPGGAFFRGFLGGAVRRTGDLPANLRLARVAWGAFAFALGFAFAFALGAFALGFLPQRHSANFFPAAEHVVPFFFAILYSSEQENLFQFFYFYAQPLHLLSHFLQLPHIPVHT